MSDSDDAALGENVAFFPGPTAQPYAPDLLLRGALNAKLSEVIILGWDEDGELFFSGSSTSKPEILWLLESARMALFLHEPDE